jgi:hypothetical protein
VSDTANTVGAKPFRQRGDDSAGEPERRGAKLREEILSLGYTSRSCAEKIASVNELAGYFRYTSSRQSWMAKFREEILPLGHAERPVVA